MRVLRFFVGLGVVLAASAFFQWLYRLVGPGWTCVWAAGVGFGLINAMLDA